MENWIKEIICQPLIAVYTDNITNCLSNAKSEFAGTEMARIWIIQIENLMNFIDGKKSAGVN